LPLAAVQPADYVSWGDHGGFAACRHDVAPALRAALREAASLYAWAASRPDRGVFHGRGEAYAVTLGAFRVVVRHARRGGLVRLLSRDRFLGRTPRFIREIALSRRLAAAGIRTPAVLAGVAYPALFSHTADIATERLDGPDLAALLFGDAPPEGERRAAILAAVGRMVRRLHAAGFVHPDLQLRNVLVLTKASSLVSDPSSVEAALLDVDTCRERSPRDTRAHLANRKRFLRSWDKWNRLNGVRLTADDRRLFLAAYDAALIL
jgi:tRNA A-37 threonylcarbamoyl transferase component Bud32